MVAPLLIAGAALAGAGVGGALFGQKKVKDIDISQQLALAKQNAERQRRLVDTNYGDINKNIGTYETGANAGIGEQLAQGLKTQGEYLSDSAALTDQAKNALRANLYSTEMSALPDALKAVREASAAGSGINSGAYQQAVAQTGQNTARNIATGERDIQVAGLHDQQAARAKAFDTFSALSSKLGDQKMAVLTKVMDSKNAALVQQTGLQMGLNDQETQSLIDLMNFQQSGTFASDSAAAANRAALWNSLIGGGGALMGYGARPAATAPQAAPSGR